LPSTSSCTAHTAQVSALKTLDYFLFAAPQLGFQCARSLQAQKPAANGRSAPQRSRSMGGISTAGTFAPVYDAEKRPITAGGFVDKDKGTVVFEDATKAAGLSNWRHVMGTPDKKYILETDGSGVGLIDYDNDGWLDIYMVNGSTYDALSGKKTPPHAALFHNNHDGTFTDVAAKAGVTNDRWGFGVAIGDFDNDGWPDIFVANYGKNRLYHNNHNGTFTDVARKGRRHAGQLVDGATWGDYDGDGRLDLFVSGYVHYDLKHQPTATDTRRWPFRVLPVARTPVMCGPHGLQGRARSPVPQQRRRHVYRCEREGRRLRSRRLLRIHRHLCGREQRRQGRPAGRQRFRAQLSLHQQGRRHV
jgi:hypothetical protein